MTEKKYFTTHLFVIFLTTIINPIQICYVNIKSFQNSSRKKGQNLSIKSY